MQSRRPRARKRARSSIVWGLSVFCALQAGLILATESWLPDIRDPEFGIRYKLLAQRLKNATRQPLTVVVFGSSRTTVGLCGGRLESSLSAAVGRPVVVFNFGLTGAGPILEQLSLRRLLERGIRPDLVLLELLPPHLAGQSAHERDRIARERLWFDEISLFEKYGASRDALRGQWWDSWPLPWYRHRFAILSRFAPAFVPLAARLDWLYMLDASGFVSGFRSRERGPSPAETAFALAEYAPYFKGFRLEGVSTQALHDLLELCQAEALDTALLVMPEGTSFRESYPTQVRSMIQTYLHGLAREFAIPVIDARTWVPDDEFRDGHHLLYSGAKRFTERLGKEALLPMLLSTSPGDVFAHKSSEE